MGRYNSGAGVPLQAAGRNGEITDPFSRGGSEKGQARDPMNHYRENGLAKLQVDRVKGLPGLPEEALVEAAVPPGRTPFLGYIYEADASLMPNIAAIPLLILALIFFAVGALYLTTCNGPSLFLIGVALMLGGGAAASFGSVRAGLVVLTVGVMVLVIGFFLSQSIVCGV